MRPHYSVLYFLLYYFIFRFLLEKSVSLVCLQQLDIWSASWALQRPPLAALLRDVFAVCAKEPRRWALDCFFVKKMFCLKKYFVFSVFFRFSKVMYSQLGSWWCRRALRGAPRTLRDADKNDKRGQKSSWRPAGVSQKV